MPSSSSPIEIATSRNSSSSPRNPTSNLTSQLQQEQTNRNTHTNGTPDVKGRQESTAGMLGTTPYGGRGVPMPANGRRESYQVSGSLMGGMSWGGISMGSFIRDDILMAGTSPYHGMQSPSFHSSSYLPKMEANYMRDYVCCDIHLDSMHELLQHYEEAHAAQPTQTMGRTPKDQQYPSRAANPISTAQAVQQQAQTNQPNMPPQYHMPHLQNPPQQAPSPLFSGQSSDQIGHFDSLDDMDMDMNEGTPGPQPQGSQFQPQPQFGRQQPRGPSVNVNLANAFQGQGLNSATPTTPHATQPNLSYPNNPTVSSVNTPSLTTQTASQQTATPDPSQPSTPAELDPDFLAQMGNLNSADYNQLMQGNFDFNNFNNLSNLNNGGSATIDNPEKRLLSKQGYGNKGFQNPAFTNAQNTAINKVRENQLLNGLAGVGGFVGEEIKPFKCPVIGCEKAYKNQNGLKYHKQHGHQNQQLKENPDGTFSIVDPATSIPYPGTVGMEKEKPYRCEVCGKRYKNLNGLKYHRQHSPPCNPELRTNISNVPGLPNNLQNLNANVAGAGLVGINESMGY
ncbi:Transcription factor SFP1 [Fulvia fulva]|uniref:Transcription factor SFP1 n=1 Tax=Passalora fulva TaxID=5499 RepID=A0A9Q8PHK3_PASFU|nr:Transcription factor SFP1 [Fulvia fulva]KAK4626446.1 Transcription factor SFP1 [Fulvia fulva]KAK4627459.1 Transcription factor SFP1 [Fulvia fulva]UJO22535.1 Transcription factor SFP1 [Fulvia fulva]WPV13291.1 Transcription factor SFP1 [Fulvia fulva]WPV28108.1 Transcription factor SFP1 [Fulvia fulva]